MNFSVFTTEIINMNKEIEEENKAITERQKQIEEARPRPRRRR